MIIELNTLGLAVTILREQSLVPNRLAPQPALRGKTGQNGRQ